MSKEFCLLNIILEKCTKNHSKNDILARLKNIVYHTIHLDPFSEWEGAKLAFVAHLPRDRISVNIFVKLFHFIPTGTVLGRNE